MKMLIAAATLMFVTTSFAATKAEMMVDAKSEEAKTLQAYLNCKPKASNEEALLDARACGLKLISDKASLSQKDRLVAWLFEPIQVLRIRNCGQKEKHSLKLFKEQTPDMVCFEFGQGQDLRFGAAFFKDAKLWSLHY